MLHYIHHHHHEWGLHISLELHSIIHFLWALSCTCWSGMLMSYLIMSLCCLESLPCLWLEKSCWKTFLISDPLSCQMTCPSQDIWCFLMHSAMVVSIWSSFLTVSFLTVPPENSYNTSETPHFKEEQSSVIFLCQAPSFTSIYHNRQYKGLNNLIFKCPHILLNQIFCFSLSKACASNEIQYSVSVWMLGTILPRYLNVCKCSTGRLSISMIPLHSDKNLLLLS